MKLITCVKCSDVVKLSSKETRTCECGLSGGRYLEDDLHAEYYGPCYPLGFANDSLVNAIRNQPQAGPGKIFTTFVIERDCPTMKKLDEHYQIPDTSYVIPTIYDHEALKKWLDDQTPQTEQCKKITKPRKKRKSDA